MPHLRADDSLTRSSVQGEKNMHTFQKRSQMSCRITNKTPFALVPSAEEMWKGSFDQLGVVPRLVYANSTTKFSMTSGTFEGISGAIAMALVLPRGEIMDISLGFTNPRIGGKTSGAAFSRDLNPGWEAARTWSTEIISGLVAPAEMAKEDGWPWKIRVWSGGGDCRWEVVAEHVEQNKADKAHKM